MVFDAAAAVPAFVRVDLTTGASVSIPVPPVLVADARLVAVSDDATRVLLDTAANSLVAGDQNGLDDTYLFDTTANTFELIDQGPAGRPASSGSFANALSADGRYAVFQSSAPEVAAGGGVGALLLRDRTLGTTTRIDTPPPGVTLASAGPATISADGRFVKFRGRYVAGGVGEFVLDRNSAATVTLPFVDGVLSNDGNHVWGFSGSIGPVQRFDVVHGTVETFGATAGVLGTVLAVSDDDRWAVYRAQPPTAQLFGNADPFYAHYELDRTTGLVAPAAAPVGADAVSGVAQSGELLGRMSTESAVWRAAAGIPTLRVRPAVVTANRTTSISIDVSDRSTVALPPTMHGAVPPGSPVVASIKVDAAAASTTQFISSTGPSGCVLNTAIEVLPGPPANPPPVVDEVVGGRVMRRGGQSQISLVGSGFNVETNIVGDVGLSAVRNLTDGYNQPVLLSAAPDASLGFHSLTVDNNGEPLAVPRAVVVREPAGEFAPSTPTRLYDSRQAYFGLPTPLGPGETRTIRLGSLGVGPASAVVVNVTAVDPTSDTFLTVFPPGVGRPAASNLNVVRGETRANLVMVGTNGPGEIQVYNNAGTVDLVVDAVGTYQAPIGGLSAGSAFVGFDPVRVLDSRVDLSRPFGAREYLRLPIVKPGSPVRAALLNVTVTNTTASSYLSVVPAGVDPTLSSNINWTRGATTPNLVVVPLSPDGKVDIYNNAGMTDVVVDLLGVYDDGTLPLFYGQFGARTPIRVLDTRIGLGAATGSVDPAVPISLDLGAVGVVPADALSVVLNVTVTEPVGPGHVTVWPADIARPESSNLNYQRGQTAANLVVVPLAAGNVVRLGTGTSHAHLIADVVGWMGRSGSRPAVDNLYQTGVQRSDEVVIGNLLVHGAFGVLQLRP